MVNSCSTGNQHHSVVATDDAGNFVVAWRGLGQDCTNSDIFAKRHDSGGISQGGEFTVNSVTTGSDAWPAIAMAADGDFVAVWQDSNKDPSANDILARVFDAAGTPKGEELEVNTFTTSGQAFSAVAMDADGDFVVAWESFGQEGSSDGVFAQRFQGDGPVAGDFTVDGRADIRWRNTSSGANVTWLMDGFSKAATGGIGGVPPAWEVAGLGTFDSDARWDILWRNTGTGATLVWQMDGFVKDNVGAIGGVPLVWEVQ